MLLIFISIIISGGFAGLMYKSISAKKGALDSVVNQLQADLQRSRDLTDSFLTKYAEMLPAKSFRVEVTKLNEATQMIRAERGRITITQSELEAVENRLRELDEIDRELDASSMETKEELNILAKKHADIRNKNEKLKKELEDSMASLDDMLQDLELNAQQQEQVDNMKGELASSQSRIDTVLIAIEQANDQYVLMKKRYDALDIEYAQLYEKFTEAEAMFDS